MTTRGAGPHRWSFVLIAINVVIFLLELNGGEAFIREWAFIPREFSATPVGEAITLFSAMFMHGGWLHLFGNMLYLWIFGDNIEDEFGPVGFLVLYLVCGLAAFFAQFMVAPQSNVPNVGASGAIAGVLGAYLLMFPQARVNVLVGRQIVAMPALIVLGLWIMLQIFAGAGSIARTTTTSDTGGVRRRRTLVALPTWRMSADLLPGLRSPFCLGLGDLVDHCRSPERSLIASSTSISNNAQRRRRHVRCWHKAAERRLSAFGCEADLRPCESRRLATRISMSAFSAKQRPTVHMVHANLSS